MRMPRSTAPIPALDLQVSAAGLVRFWASVGDRSDPEACWIWLGGLNSAGRPGFLYDGRIHRSNRFIYAAVVGAIPAGIVVRHQCDNARCVNPNHLLLGTQKDNVQDCIDRGRRVFNRGSKHHMTTLTEDQVQEIRGLVRQGLTLKAIGERYGIGLGVVWSIKARKTWGHLQDDA